MVDRFRGYSFRHEAGLTRQAVAKGTRQANHIMEENELRQPESALDAERSRVGGQLINLLVGRMANAPLERGVTRNSAGQVIEIRGVNHVPSGSYRDPKVVRSRDEQDSLLRRYDVTSEKIGEKLALWGLREWDEPVNNIFWLQVEGDQKYQGILDSIKLKALPVIFAGWPGKDSGRGILAATVLSRIEKGAQVNTICLGLERLVSEKYRKIYLPEPLKLSPDVNYSVMFEDDFPANAEAEFKGIRILVGSLNWQEKGFDAESVLLLAASEEGFITMGDVWVPKGAEQFFYRSGSMFSRKDAQKLQTALVRSESPYTPTSEELKLVDFLGSYPRAAVEGIKGNITKHPDRANGRIDIGTRDRLTVVLAGLDVNQLAAEVSSGQFHFSALDKCLSGGKDNLLIQVNCPEGEDPQFKAAVVRPVEGKNQYTESLLPSRAIIEAYQKNCPGFSISILRQRINNEFANSLAFAHIISKLTPSY